MEMDRCSLEHLGFPDYEVYYDGSVRNTNTGRILHISFTKSGSAKVGLMSPSQGHQVTVSVAHIVATCWMAHSDDFDHVINKDGDRSNNAVDNLAWRPGWFAKMYHRQYTRRSMPIIQVPIQETSSRTVYHNSWHACMVHGLLDRDVAGSVINGGTVFPTGQAFQLYDLE